MRGEKTQHKETPKHLPSLGTEQHAEALPAGFPPLPFPVPLPHHGSWESRAESRALA